MTETYFAPYAWLPTGLASDVRIDVVHGRFGAVSVNSPAQRHDIVLDGIALPGFANTHSHAFHRALRGRTHDAQAGSTTFWSWREQMFRIAAALDPDSYLALARALFAEMALAGVSCVGEFHYLHHDRDGTPYGEPNVMGAALMEAARQAGIRITLLDTCYLAGGLDASGPLPPAGVQVRFADQDVDAWAQRFAALGATGGHARIGAAIHSVRAVPREAIPVVVEAARGMPLHVHLSEQVAENEQCVAAYGVTPTALLAAAGALGPLSSAVHATHPSEADIAELGASRTSISMCPSTERDLADGIGPAARLRDAGAPITLGSDQHVQVDLLAEARALEDGERLAGGVRGRFTPAELLEALTGAGHRSLGWDDAGRIEPGARADLSVVRLDTPRTAGIDPAQVALAGTAADVATVVVDGRVIVQDGQHILGDVGRLLADGISALG